MSLLDPPIWHCFGVRHEKVPLEMALRMLDASGTRLLPVNTNQTRLLVGHGSIGWQEFKKYAEQRNLTACINVNLQTTAAHAIARTIWAYEHSGIRLVKLEVLNADLKTSNDEACFDAACMLREAGFEVMPLLSDNMLPGYYGAFPITRVMGSPIGSGEGIRHLDRIRRICEANENTRIVLDGGIGSPKDAKLALDLGCAGFLVNSALFQDERGPVEALRDYAAVVRQPVAA